MKKTLAVLVAVAAAHGAMAAPTASPFAQERVTLSLRNLDLATPEGQRRLSIRMDQAARAVCGDGLSNISLSVEAQSRACQSDVRADIQARIEGRATTAQLQKTANIQLAMR